MQTFVPFSELYLYMKKNKSKYMNFQISIGHSLLSPANELSFLLVNFYESGQASILFLWIL